MRSFKRNALCCVVLYCKSAVAVEWTVSWAGWHWTTITCRWSCRSHSSVHSLSSSSSPASSAVVVRAPPSRRRRHPRCSPSRSSLAVVMARLLPRRRSPRPPTCPGPCRRPPTADTTSTRAASSPLDAWTPPGTAAAVLRWPPTARWRQVPRRRRRPRSCLDHHPHCALTSNIASTTSAESQLNHQSTFDVVRVTCIRRSVGPSLSLWDRARVQKNIRILTLSYSLVV